MKAKEVFEHLKALYPETTYISFNGMYPQRHYHSGKKYRIHDIVKIDWERQTRYPPKGRVYLTAQDLPPVFAVRNKISKIVGTVNSVSDKDFMFCYGNVDFNDSETLEKLQLTRVDSYDWQEFYREE